MCFDVNVLANCTFADRTRSSGTSLSTAGFLQGRESVEYANRHTYRPGTSVEKSLLG